MNDRVFITEHLVFADRTRYAPLTTIIKSAEKGRLNPPSPFSQRPLAVTGHAVTSSRRRRPERVPRTEVVDA